MSDQPSPPDPSSVAQHRTAAHAQIEPIPCAVLTVSDTRTVQTDKGGALIRDRLLTAGHEVVDQTIVPDEPDAIEGQLQRWLRPAPSGDDPHPRDRSTPDANNEPRRLEVIITTGGTGISSRDTTIEIVSRELDRTLEGFGELFRMLSFEQVGPAAMLSRAVAGLAGQTLIFALPGSTHAVALAMDRLIVPELPHLVWERRR